MTRIAAIALGSNLSSDWGGPEENLREAVRRVAGLGHVRAISRWHRTEPVGFTDQPDFLNGTLLLETDLEPLELMRGLLAIEREMGRDRTLAPPKGPRLIDLDLLLLDDVVVASPEVTLPHPAMAERRFVLEPLAEIASRMVEPVSGRTVAELLKLLDA
jgi:2-amino-4-hydroxy-6-hydroxymethyldihydropteridine diphosphokinase